MNNSAVPPARNASTICEYERIVKRTQPEILNNVRLPGENVLNPRTRALERAAWRWCLKDLLMDISRPSAVHEICRQLLQKMKRASELAMKNYSDRILTGAPAPLKTTRQTKRHSLKGLDIDWRQQMLQRAAIRFPNEVDALRTLAVTGVRPIELEKGVAVCDPGSEVSFSVAGAKTGEWDHGRNAGQASRQITISKSHPYLGQNIAKSFIALVNRRRLEYVVQRLSRELWPRRTGKRSISCYSFRHAFAAELKAQKFTGTEIACALGHQSTLSQSYYGSQSQGSARGEARFLVEVWAINEVRLAAAATKKKPPPKKNRRAKLIEQVSVIENKNDSTGPDPTP
jgi:integrase